MSIGRVTFTHRRVPPVGPSGIRNGVVGEEDGAPAGVPAAIDEGHDA